jgi:hypothetical protein
MSAQGGGPGGSYAQGNPYGPGGQPVADPYQQGGYPNPYGTPPRRRRPVALIVILSIVGLCLLVCVGTVVFAYTQIGPGIRDTVSELTSTEVAQQLGPVGAAEPGIYVLTAEALTAGLNQQLASNGSDISAAEVAIDPTRIRITVDLGSQTVAYQAGVAVEDGRIRLTDAQADAGFLGNVIPEDWVAGGLEDGLNAWFTASDLTVSSIELAEGEARVTTQRR